MIRLVVLALLVAGCAASGAGASPVATDRVDMPKSYRFAPESITVAAGSTVTWTNSDNFSHSVQLEGEDAPGLVAKPGESVSRAFPTPGTYSYVCSFHPTDMRGVVVVEAA